MAETIIQTVVALNAVTATTTSQVIPCKGAKKITLLFTRANHSSGSTAFTVPVSIDDTTYVDCAMLIDNLANSNSQDVTRVASKTLNADGSAILAIDLSVFAFSSLKVTATETTDGTHSATVYLEY